MKRSGFKRKVYKPLKKTKLNVVGHSSASKLKEEIQKLVRDIVIIRDGGCIFRNIVGHDCSGYANDGHLILQADHLITRANSATYADTRLIVCVCKGAHGWKKYHEKEYNKLIRTILSKEIIKLWDRCEEDRARHTGRPQDWRVHILLLKKELETYKLTNKQSDSNLATDVHTIM